MASGIRKANLICPLNRKKKLKAKSSSGKRPSQETVWKRNGEGDFVPSRDVMLQRKAIMQCLRMSRSKVPAGGPCAAVFFDFVGAHDVPRIPGIHDLADLATRYGWNPLSCSLTCSWNGVHGCPLVCMTLRRRFKQPPGPEQSHPWKTQTKPANRGRSRLCWLPPRG